MRITVNGEERETTAVTVTALLESLDIDPVRVAVELNREILPKAEFACTPVNDGDTVEIVHFVGGGSIIRRKKTFF